MKDCIFARNVGSRLHIIMALYGRQIAVMDRSSVTIAVINQTGIATKIRSEKEYDTSRAKRICCRGKI